ncbi:MAG: TetR/AcrR family transcriptional regulator [Mesorhizobium sp.]
MAALATLSELGYARTSLREIAQKCDFTHGVFHYYFTDKVDLILCAVRNYKTDCSKRYDAIIASSTTAEELVDGFLAKLGDTLRDEAHMHRLWYDLRSQAMFEDAFRTDVLEIDQLLEDMINRVSTRLSELSGHRPAISRRSLYAVFDGLFQKHLLEHLEGDLTAVERLRTEIRALLPSIM